MSRNTTYVKGLIFALLAGILWGITGPLGEYLFKNKGIVPEWLVPYRMLVTGLLMLSALYMKKRGKIFDVWKSGKDAIQMIVYGIAGMMTVQYSFFVAVQVSNGGTATVLQYTNPVMIVLYYTLFKRIRPTRREVLSVFMVLAGIFLLSTNGNIHTLVITPMGLIMGLLCGFFSCLYAMLPKNLLMKYDSPVVCGWGMFLGGIVLAVWKQPWRLGIGADMEVWGLFAVLIVLGTIIPFTMSLSAIPVIGAMYANVLGSIEPVVASLLTFFILGTTFGGFEIVGFALIIATILILTLQKQSKGEAK